MDAPPTAIGWQQENDKKSSKSWAAAPNGTRLQIADGDQAPIRPGNSRSAFAPKSRRCFVF
jgi:hypothetical protein